MVCAKRWLIKSFHLQNVFRELTDFHEDIALIDAWQQAGMRCAIKPSLITSDERTRIDETPFQIIIETVFRRDERMCIIVASLCPALLK
jgi:hypothetical protein